MTEKFGKDGTKLGLLDVVQRNSWNIPIGLAHVPNKKAAIDCKSSKNMDTNVIRSEAEYIKLIVPAIKAAVRITDINLIAMDNRIKANRRVVSSDRVILQSEALAIFKGNFIRMLKQIYGSSEINRIKSQMSLIIGLDSVHPIINRIGVDHVHVRDYTPLWMERVFEVLRKSFGQVGSASLDEEGFIALRDTPNVKSKFPAEIMNISDVNLDTIKNIKF